jgi:hypothetical protein
MYKRNRKVFTCIKKNGQAVSLHEPKVSSEVMSRETIPGFCPLKPDEKPTVLLQK